MGNPIALFVPKPAEAKKPFKKGSNKQMAHLAATVETLVKKGHPSGGHCGKDENTMSVHENTMSVHENSKIAKQSVMGTLCANAVTLIN
jgi:hypothetical protein